MFVLGLTAAGLAPSFGGQLDDVADSVGGGIEDVQAWLSDGPLGVGEARVDDAMNRVGDELRDNAGRLVGGLLSGVVAAAEVVASLLLSIVLAFFFVRDGDAIWTWTVKRWPVDGGSASTRWGAAHGPRSAAISGASRPWRSPRP